MDRLLPPFFLITPILITILACSGEKAIDEPANTGPGFFTSIYSENVLDATLTFDLDSVNYYKEAVTDHEVDGTLTLLADSLIEIPVEIRSRGVTRKNLCPFPPLRVQLKKDAVGQNGWGPYRNYKLVTHCSDSLRDEELLFREYLVYRMYEQLTDLCFNAQLLRMTYYVNGDTLKRFAVLIENEEEMNQRLGLQELDPETTKITRIHLEHYKSFVLFQYMIGNTDWNLGTGHNTKYVLEPGSETPIVIPYDFDYCGLVNASYASPYSTLPTKNVRERYFMYRGKKEDDFSAAIDEFLTLKDTWYELIQTFPYLSDDARDDILSWLDSFFVTIERPGWKDEVFTQ